MTSTFLLGTLIAASLAPLAEHENGRCRDELLWDGLSVSHAVVMAIPDGLPLPSSPTANHGLIERRLKIATSLFGPLQAGETIRAELRPADDLVLTSNPARVSLVLLQRLAETEEAGHSEWLVRDCRVASSAAEGAHLGQLADDALELLRGGASGDDRLHWAIDATLRAPPRAEMLLELIETRMVEVVTETGGSWQLERHPDPRLTPRTLARIAAALLRSPPRDAETLFAASVVLGSFPSRSIDALLIDGYSRLVEVDSSDTAYHDFLEQTVLPEILARFDATQLAERHRVTENDRRATTHNARRSAWSRIRDDLGFSRRAVETNGTGEPRRFDRSSPETMR